MGVLKVRRAETRDLHALVALITQYYERRGTPVQWRPEADWWVATLDGHVYAVQSYKDSDTPCTERWVMDTYAAQGRYGKLCLKALLDASHARADAEHVTLLGVTEEDNFAHRAVLRPRGWEVVGVLGCRKPQEVRS